MSDNDEISRQLRAYMNREIARTQPVDLEHVRTRGSRRRRLNRFAIAAAVATVLAVVGGTLVVVAGGPDRNAISAAADSRVRILILPGSGNEWVAFAVQNDLTTGVGYGGVGTVDRRSGSSWRQVGYFASIGGSYRGPITRREPTDQLMVQLGAGPDGLGVARWIDVSSLSPGTYRLRQTVDAADESLTASGVFHISDGGAAQAPPEESRARIDPEPSVVNGAPMTLAFLLVGGTGDLVSDNKIEQATSRTVHVRRWERGRWVEVVSRESVRVRDTRSTVTLPELAPGLYQLARTKSSGDEIRGWLFVTPAVAPLDNAMTSQRCSASSAVSADIDGDRESDRVYLVFTDSGARLGACTTSGQSDEVDCAGQAENLLVVPMPQPQRTVIMCGGSSVSEVGLTPYVWELESSTLRKTPLPDSDNAGFTSGRAPDGLAYEQFGCLPKIGGDRVIAQLQLENRGSAWAWTRRAYSITRDGARLVDTQSGTVPTPTQQFVDTVVPHCGGRSPSGEEPRIVISP